MMTFACQFACYLFYGYKALFSILPNIMSVNLMDRGKIKLYTSVFYPLV